MKKDLGQAKRLIRIEEICRRSGYSKLTLNRYVRMGLLRKPIKTGSRSFYDKGHLERLREIRRLRKKEGLSVPQIKNLLKGHENVSENLTEDNPPGKREQIINKAIEFFSKNGFTGTSIEEITDALGIAKGTFYLYFKSKKELLIDCIGQLTTTIVVPKEVWEDIRRETDYIRRHKKRLTAFLKAFPTFVGILNLIRMSLQSNDLGLVKKAGDTYRMLVNPLRKDLRWAIRHGVVQEVDEEIFSFLLWGVGEGLGYLLMIDPRYTIEEVAEIGMDFLARGVLSPEAESTIKSETEHLDWDVMDCTGLTVRLRNISFNQRSHFSGWFGKGEVRVPLNNITSVLLNHEGTQVSAVVSASEGEKIILRIDIHTILTGESYFGTYSAELNQISAISLVQSTEESGVQALDEAPAP